MYKKTIHLLGVLLLVSWLSPTAFALAMNWSVDRFLTEVLDELSEKYQVFFTYDAQLLKEIKVDYQYDKEANITIIIAALLHNTGLRYEQLSEKYFVLYKDNDSGRKIMKKMKRKLNDLEKLERMGNFALQSQNSSKSDQRLTQINQALENLPFQQIKGVIEDENGEALIGASIRVKDSNIGVATNINGQFELKIPKHFKTLLISYIGFQDQEITIGKESDLSIILKKGISLSEIQVVGSRSYNRSATDSPVAIDIIDLDDIVKTSGKVEINQLLQYAAPSFNASKQSGSDGSDHIDPASLRGLGPDQTLILINGKRRHQSSLVNIFGIRGRGNTGTDLNAIPIGAIERIEILRDGASAQYGSDAIAGVINVVLKKTVDKLTGSLTLGAYQVATGELFPEEAYNIPGNFLSTQVGGNAIAKDKRFDGQQMRLSANYGLEIGKKGFLNMTGEYLSKARTLRPTFGWRRGFGEAAIEAGSFMLNMAIPLSEQTEIYAFGGRNQRATDAFAWTRDKDQDRNVIAIYPNGFTPRITSSIIDNSIAVGMRTQSNSGWKIDISNTYGQNDFHYFIKETLNASLEKNSPTQFDAGGHAVFQNTAGFDFSKYFGKGGSRGINFAFGFEFRTENFSIFAGEEGSYALYDVNGKVVTNPAQEVSLSPAGGFRPAGSQGFPGYSPDNEVNESRSNLAAYIDTEFDLSARFLVSTAARFEQYSDFGSTLNGKLATRFKISDDLIVRGSLSSGFRAPSLTQLFYNLSFTQYISGVPAEAHLVANNNSIARVFGIDQLLEEKALNAALGFAYTKSGFTTTIDAYQITVKDRIVLTNNFDAAVLQSRIKNVQFFANGVDTKTVGLDVILTYAKTWGQGTLKMALAANFNNMKISKIHQGDLDEQLFFSERDQTFLLASAPDRKVNINLTYSINQFKLNLGASNFAGITLVDYNQNKDSYAPATVLDAGIGLQLGSKISINLGINNLFNKYPTLQNDGFSETGGYWDPVQMGFGGIHYFVQLGFSM